MKVLIVCLAFTCLLNVSSSFLLPHWIPSCDQLVEYKAIVNALYTNPCISDTQIWKMIEPFRVKSRVCLSDLIIKVAAHVETHRGIGSDCYCSHDFERVAYIPLGFNQDHFMECLTKNPGCQFWPHLRDVHNSRGVDEQGEMVLHLSYSYSKGHEDVCQCHKNGPTIRTPTTIKVPIHNESTHKTFPAPASTHQTFPVPHLQTTPTAVPTPPTKSTVSSPTKTADTISSGGTTAVSITTHCQRFSVLGAVASGITKSHQLAYECQDGSRSSSEALVLGSCNIGLPITWKAGLNVMKNCNKIPEYTPIAMFGTRYLGLREHPGVSGIFMGCTPGGFKMAFQDCGIHAMIKHVETTGGQAIDDPTNYFVIS